MTTTSAPELPARPALPWLPIPAVIGVFALAKGLLLSFWRPDLLVLLIGVFGIRQTRLAFALLILGGVLALIVLLRAGRARSWAVQLARVTLLVGVLAAPATLWFGRTPFNTVPISYRSSDAELAATLYLPPTPGRHPAVVIVHGSAPSKRMFYDLWADRIARKGFVVLLADNTSSANITRLAEDVIAGVDYLTTRAEVDTSHIGLVGLSQGGWVAPRAAERSTRIKFLALITGPPVSIREKEIWSTLRGHDAVPRPRAEAILDTLTPGGVDSRGALAHLTAPSLWLFGGEDNSIPTAKSVRALVALARVGRPVTWRTFEGYGHLLVGRNGTFLPRVAPGSWPVLLNWLVLQGGPAAAR